MGSFGFRWLKPHIRKWLAERALVLPAAKREEIADRLGIPLPLVEFIEGEIRKYILEQFDRL
jgi:hypothetical protein